MLTCTVWRGHVATVVRFFGAARRYWLSVFPRVSVELRAWHRRASAIADPLIRSLALEAERKRGNMEGAAIFAAFAPRGHRPSAIAAAVRFQSAYNYVDLLGEQPCKHPRLNGYRLHEALLIALRPGAAHLPYYAHFDSGAAGSASGHAAPAAHHAEPAFPGEEAILPMDDGGYLGDLVTGCQRALLELPSLDAVSEAVLSGAERVICFQALNSGHEELGHAPLASWGRQITPDGSGLTWWEAAAAAGSSLGVLALIAAAADPALRQSDVAALDRAYFPWIGGLHSLLDNLVDTGEDAQTGQLSLLSHYPTSGAAAERMQWLAERSIAAASELPAGFAHVLMLGAMAGFYLADPEAGAGEVRPIRDRVRRALGAPADLAVVVFRCRRCIGTVNPRVQGGGAGRSVDVEEARPVAVHGDVREMAPQTHAVPAGKALSHA